MQAGVYPRSVYNNLYSPSRQKQYTKYKRVRNYKTKPKTEDRQYNVNRYIKIRRLHIIKHEPTLKITLLYKALPNSILSSTTSTGNISIFKANQ